MTSFFPFPVGNSGTFTRLFFLESPRAIGNYVVFSASSPSVAFIVKNWTFAGSGLSPLTAPYTHVNIPPDNFDDFMGNSSYVWRYSEVNDESGDAGQGNANPASLISNHQMALIDGHYYDASYGNAFASKDAALSLDGYLIVAGLPLDEPAVNVDLNGDGDVLDLQVGTAAFPFKSKGGSLEVDENTTTY